MGAKRSPPIRPARALLLAGVFFTQLFDTPVVQPRGPSVPPAARPRVQPADTATATSTPDPGPETPSPSPPTESATASETSSPASETATSSATAQTPSPTQSPTPQSATPSLTASPSSTGSPSASPTASPEASFTQTPSPEPSYTPTPAATATLPSPTAVPTPTEAPTAFPPQLILINEVAWAGTIASAADEWIELHNTGPVDLSLAGWWLRDGGDINISLTGVIPAYGYFLLERTADDTVADISASQIYSGALSDGGESLELTDPAGQLVDSCNIGGGGWPAGDKDQRYSMERWGGADLPGNWASFTGYGGVGLDAGGNPIGGTPGSLNSVLLATPTPTPAIATPGPTPSAYPAGAVLINELAWAGTLASSSDEWIELHNPGPADILLDGWTLSDSYDLNIQLGGLLPAFGYYLLERSDDQTVADISADLIYTGTLNNSGEVLLLKDPSGELIDSANADGGSWPAGLAESRASMERRGGADVPGNWGTFTGFHGNGLDAQGNPVPGTPRAVNSLFFPTPIPTWIPGRVVINEVLIRPRHDWEGKGGVTTADEFIELYNRGPDDVYLKGWWLDDIANGGSKPYDLPGVTIPAKGFAVFFRSKSRLALNDAGDSVRLMDPQGHLLDQVSYLPVRAYNLSYGRLPDGSNRLAYGLWPTPGEANLLFEEAIPPAVPGPFYPLVCAGGQWPAGGNVVRASMERRGLPDNPGSWVSFAGNKGSGRDAKGNLVGGTPGGPNWANDYLDLAGLAMQSAAPLISEVAWAGTRASATDEWIELYNPSAQPIDLEGWVLTDGNDIRIQLGGVLAPGGYALLERTDDQAISDIPAALTYTGRMDDAGETLWLIDPSGRVADSANAVGPGRPDPLLDRLGRAPGSVAWLWELGLLGCNPDPRPLGAQPP